MLDVVAGLIIHQSRVLVCRRPEGKARAGMWEFPGGKREAGETPAQALAREIREELDADITVLSQVAQAEYDYPDVSVRLTLLSARLEEGGVRPMEHQTARWASPKELPGLDFCPADRLLLDGALAFLRSFLKSES